MVKLKIHAFLSYLKNPKVHTVKGFSGLLLFCGNSCWARSQSRRATNCATPRCVILFSFQHCFPLCTAHCQSRRGSLENIVASATAVSAALYFLTSATHLHLPPPAVYCFAQLRYTPLFSYATVASRRSGCLLIIAHPFLTVNKVRGVKRGFLKHLILFFVTDKVREKGFFGRYICSTFITRVTTCNNCMLYMKYLALFYYSLVIIA